MGSDCFLFPTQPLSLPNPTINHFFTMIWLYSISIIFFQFQGMSVWQFKFYLPSRAHFLTSTHYLLLKTNHHRQKQIFSLFFDYSVAYQSLGWVIQSSRTSIPKISLPEIRFRLSRPWSLLKPFKQTEEKAHFIFPKTLKNITPLSPTPELINCSISTAHSLGKFSVSSLILKLWNETEISKVDHGFHCLVSLSHLVIFWN